MAWHSELKHGFDIPMTSNEPWEAIADQYRHTYAQNEFDSALRILKFANKEIQVLMVISRGIFALPPQLEPLVAATAKVWYECFLDEENAIWQGKVNDHARLALTARQQQIKQVFVEFQRLLGDQAVKDKTLMMKPIYEIAVLLHDQILPDSDYCEISPSGPQKKIFIANDIQHRRTKLIEAIMNIFPNYPQELQVAPPLIPSALPSTSTAPPPIDTTPPSSTIVHPSSNIVPPPIDTAPPSATIVNPSSNAVPPPIDTTPPSITTVHASSTTVSPVNTAPPSTDTPPPSTTEVPRPTTTLPPNHNRRDCLTLHDLQRMFAQNTKASTSHSSPNNSASVPPGAAITQAQGPSREHDCKTEGMTLNERRVARAAPVEELQKQDMAGLEAFRAISLDPRPLRKTQTRAVDVRRAIAIFLQRTQDINSQDEA